MIDLLLYALPSVLDHINRAKDKADVDASASLHDQVLQLASAVEEITKSDEQQAQIIETICRELQGLTPANVTPQLESLFEFARDYAAWAEAQESNNKRVQRWLYWLVGANAVIVVVCMASQSASSPNEV